MSLSFAVTSRQQALCLGGRTGGLLLGSAGVQAERAVMFPFSLTSDSGLVKNCVDNILSIKKPVFSGCVFQGK